MKDLNGLLIEIETFFKEFKILSEDSYDELYKKTPLFFKTINMSLDYKIFRKYTRTLEDLLKDINQPLVKELTIISNILNQTEEALLFFKENQRDAAIRKTGYLALSTHIDSLYFAIGQFKFQISCSNLFDKWKKDFYAGYISWDVIPDDVKSLILVFLSQGASTQDILQFRLLNKKANAIFVNFLTKRIGAEWLLNLFEKKLYDNKMINAIVNFCRLNNCLGHWKNEKGFAYLLYALCTDDFKNIDQNKVISILESLKDFQAKQFKRVIINLRLMNLLSDIPQEMSSEYGKAWKNRYKELQSVNISKKVEIFLIYGRDITNLGYLNLSKADLSYKDLSGICLGGANLKYANLTYAKLIDVSLCHTNLENANLTGANLSIVTFFETNATNAIFDDIQISGNSFARSSNFSNIKLGGSKIVIQAFSADQCDFNDVVFNEKSVKKFTINSKNCSFNDTKWEKMSLSGWFINASFHGATFDEIEIDAEISSAKFNNATLNNLSFYKRKRYIDPKDDFAFYKKDGHPSFKNAVITIKLDQLDELNTIFDSTILNEANITLEGISFARGIHQ